VTTHDLELDVSDAIDLPGRSTIAVTVQVPDEPKEQPVVLFGYPGGGYGRRYFDIRTRPGYSQADFHAERGDVFVSCDHLAVGDSSTPDDPFALTYENLAAANHAAASHVLAGLRSGTLVPGVPAVDPQATFAMGQSMGGCLLTVQQANHRTFDGVAFLGWSGIFTNFPARDGGRLVYDMPSRGALLTAMPERTAESAPDLDHYRYCFHWDDEDPALVEPDLASYVPYTGLVRGDEATPWGSASIPPCAITMMTPGSVHDEAAAIDVPVFVGSGARDTVPEPWAEPGAYRASPLVAVSVTQRMAHMHNFARTRTELWNRLSGFAHLLDGR
jgi:alpha-beta hydrolase superfamily lysophospholipase